MVGSDQSVLHWNVVVARLFLEAVRMRGQSGEVRRRLRVGRHRVIRVRLRAVPVSVEEALVATVALDVVGPRVARVMVTVSLVRSLAPAEKFLHEGEGILLLIPVVQDVLAPRVVVLEAVARIRVGAAAGKVLEAVFVHARLEELHGGREDETRRCGSGRKSRWRHRDGCCGRIWRAEYSATSGGR